MSRYQMGWAVCAEGLPCTNPHDVEFSAGWCDALYEMTENGELQESGDWFLRWDDGWAVEYEPSPGDIMHENEVLAHADDFDEIYAECLEADGIGRDESLQPYLY